jgi:hypothetical protein
MASVRKNLPEEVTRPRAARTRPPGWSSAHYPRAMRATPVMRWLVIGFWLVVMSLVWLMPNYMGRIAQWFVTAWFGAIAGLGLLVLYRLERTAASRRSAGEGLTSPPHDGRRKNASAVS